MNKLIAIGLLILGLSVTSVEAQQTTIVGPLPICSSFGTASGTCAQGNDARFGVAASITSSNSTTNATFYPLVTSATGGSNPVNTASASWTYNPSTGAFHLATGVSTAGLTLDKFGGIGTNRAELFIGDGTGGFSADDFYLATAGASIHLNAGGSSQIFFGGGGYNSCTGFTTSSVGLISCIASDRNLKNSRGQVINALQILTKIPVAQVYTWKDKTKYDDRIHIGLFAQDVCKADNRLCAERITAKGEEFNYEDRGLIALLVQAVNDQQKQINTLQKTVNRLSK